MNWVDYAILAVLALSVLIGLMRGLVTEVLALVIWVAAFWTAWALGPTVAAYFRGHVGLPSARIIIGYGLCFLAVLLLGALLRFAVSRLVEGTGLSGTDRLLGMVFGLVRGAFLVTLCVLLLGFTPFTRDPWWQRSQLLPTFESASGWLARQLPATVQRYLHPDVPPGPVIVRRALSLRASAPTYMRPGPAPPGASTAAAVDARPGAPSRSF